MPVLQRCTAFIIGVIFYAYVLLTRNLPVIVAESLCQKFHMSEAMFGQYRGIYYLTYCLAHLPMAYALDRFGPRCVIASSWLLCTIGLLPMVWSDSAALLIAGRMLLGLGSSAAILSVFKINRSFFAPQQFALLLGTAGMVGYVSAFMGLGPLKQLFDSIGYEFTMMGLIVMGLALAMSAFFLVPRVSNTDQSGFVASLKQLVFNRSFWMVALIGGLIIWGLEGFADGWSVPLLTSLFNRDATTATYTTSLISVGFAVGSIVLPLVANKWQNSKQLLGASGLMLAISLAGLFIPGIPNWLIITLYVILGVFSANQVIAIDLAGKVVVPTLSMLSSAALNMVTMAFGYPFHMITALLMNGKGTMDISSNLLRYSRMDLFIGLLPFMLCAIIAYVINRKAKYDDLCLGT